MSNESSPTKFELRGVNWIRAGVKSIPYVGEALDELVYGRLDEARWARVEQSLSELGEIMRDRGIPAERANSEQFGRLLEDVVPAIGRAQSEGKRERLRSLLVNAVWMEADNPEWESARVAAELFAPLDFSAVEILAALARLNAREGAAAAVVRVPVEPARCAVVVEGSSSVELSYGIHVVEQGYRQLTNASARLVVAGAHGHNEYQNVALTALGDFVIRWTTLDEPDDDRTQSA